MTDIIVHKVDDVYVHLECERSTLREASEEFTFDVPGAKFIPSVRNKMWDGKIRLLNVNTQKLYLGLLPHLYLFAKNNDYTIKFANNNDFTIDDFSIDDAIDFISELNLDLTPRDYQVFAFSYAVQRSRCLLVSPTASGKSLIIYLLMRFYSESKILLLVPTTSLVEQMFTDFEGYAKNDEWSAEDYCHRIYSGKDKETDRPIVISTWQSLQRLKKSYFDQFDVALVDECHTAQAKSIKGILEKMTNCPIKIGFTGTLSGAKTHQLVLEGLFGKVKNVITTKQLMDDENLSQFRIKILILEHSKQVVKELGKIDYFNEVEYINTCHNRNMFIRNLVSNLKGNTLVLFKKIEHGRKLFEMISENVDCPVSFIYGGTKTDVREEVRGDTENQETSIIVASLGVFSTGINIKNLHNLVFASPSKSRIKVLQSIGRVLRKSDDGSTAVLYDIADNMTRGKRLNYTLVHSQERLKMYAEEKFNYEMKVIKLDELFKE